MRLVGVEAAAMVAIVTVAGGIVAALATAVRLVWEARDRRQKAANDERPALAVTGTEARPFIGSVRSGSRGRAVDAVQARLRERGWRVAVDGVFGPQTDRVVRQFQAEKGLEVDGVVGPPPGRPFGPQRSREPGSHPVGNRG